MYQITFCLMHQNPITCELLRTQASSLELAQQAWDMLDKSCRMLSPRPTKE